MENEKLQPSKDVVSRRVGDEIVLVNLQSDRMYSLNRTGARTWELLGEGHPLDAIQAKLADEFGVDPAGVRSELDDLLEQLVQEQLLERS